MVQAVLVDCDPGWDDAIALVLLLAKNGPDVIGVTTVCGNGTLQETTDNARRLTAFSAKPQLAVYAGTDHSMSDPGSAGPSPARPSAYLKTLPGMGPLGADDGVDFIISAAQRYQRSLTILATGPLTNIAIAIVRNPNEMKKIGRLVVVGGAWKGGNMAQKAEFNFYTDPVAADITMSAGLNPVLIPLETCEQVGITKNFRDRTRNMSTRTADFVTKIVDEQVALGNEDALKGFYDAIGALFLLNSGLFTLSRHRARIETHGASRGAVVWSDAAELERTVQAAEYINARGAYQQLYQTLSE